jgi:DNA repair protein RecO (recombination protein O)
MALHKTRGVVFRLTKFGDSSIIVTIFTDVFGLQSYIVNGVRSANSKNKIALYQPLTLLDLVVYHKQHANINRIKEVKVLHAFQSLLSDSKKSLIALFITEMLNKTVKEESHAEELFQFLYDSLIKLDTTDQHVEDFHLLFLIKLSRYLGFGAHQVNEIIGPSQLTDEEELILKMMVSGEIKKYNITNLQRRNLLDVLIRFYKDHIDTLGEIRSVQVLRDVLS